MKVFTVQTLLDYGSKYNTVQRLNLLCGRITPQTFEETLSEILKNEMFLRKSEHGDSVIQVKYAAFISLGSAV